jgi:hypothetical protein
MTDELITGFTKVGYTDDGMVFFLLVTSLEGKPIKTINQWEPKRALEISESIKQAATHAQLKRQGK